MSSEIRKSDAAEADLLRRVALQADVAKQAIREYNQIVRMGRMRDSRLKQKKSLFVERAVAEYLTLLKELNQLRSQFGSGHPCQSDRVSADLTAS